MNRAPLVKAARKALGWAISVALCFGVVIGLGVYVLFALAVGTYISGGSL